MVIWGILSINLILFLHNNRYLQRARLLKFWSKTQYCSIKGRLYVHQISVQCLPVSILLMLMTWILFTGLRTGLNSGQKVSKPTLTPAMLWRNPMFLTEKTEDKGQLERFSGINSFGKVVQNDLICYTECLGTLSGWLQCRHRSWSTLWIQI